MHLQLGASHNVYLSGCRVARSVILDVFSVRYMRRGLCWCEECPWLGCCRRLLTSGGKDLGSLAGDPACFCSPDSKRVLMAAGFRPKFKDIRSLQSRSIITSRDHNVRRA